MDAAESTSSVSGYRPVWSSPITSPVCRNGPWATVAAAVAGAGSARARYSAPSRLFCATLAVTSAGTWVSPSRPTVSVAVQSFSSILRTEPMVTSSYLTSELGTRLAALASWTVMVTSSAPRPLVKGSETELRPVQPQPEVSAPTSTATQADFASRSSIVTALRGAG